MDFLQINKLSYLHNDETIFFCKTDYIDQVFQKIRTKKHSVILITGNSDYGITDDIVNQAPTNIIKWFCQNKHSDCEVLESIPLGIENTIECYVPNNGYVWPHAIEKADFLNHQYDIAPTKFIYANFSLETNLDRPKIIDMCKSLAYITCNTTNNHVDSNTRSYEQYINKILDHQLILCPNGHGHSYDTHRLYETLYLNRIPVTFSQKQYDYLHYRFCPILITNINQLKNKEWLIEQMELVKNKINKQVLESSYWENLILTESQKIC